MNPRADYERARAQFAHGQLAECQHLADLGYRRFLTYDPKWAAKFLVLEAEAMEWRGAYEGALQLLEGRAPSETDPDASARQLAIVGIALARQHQFASANQELVRAEVVCKNADYPACGEVFRARGIYWSERGDFSPCRESFLRAFNFARSQDDRLLETSSTLNLGWTEIQLNHLDESVDWLITARQDSIQLGDSDLTEKSMANLGWAYFRLGDTERASRLLAEAQQTAHAIGNTGEELRRLSDAGYVQQNTGDYRSAIVSYERAFDLAQQTGSKKDTLDLLEDLAHLSIETGNLDAADSYLNQLAPMVKATPDRLDDLDVALAQGKLAAARGQDAQAESIFRTVAADPGSQTSMRLDAEHELAKLDERRGDLNAADGMYLTALATFEQARRELQNEESKLPFLANAAPIYDNYIRLLIKQGRIDEALAVADHSRARTLAQGLGLAVPVQPSALPLSRIAQKAGATLLFYWLGRTQSWLWIITPAKTTLVPLPPQSEIAARVTRYRDAMLGPDDPLQSENEDGVALYNQLVAPAAPLIPRGGNVIILADGALSELNFETLLAPAPHLHYWIEDATVASAPSLYMLASANAPAAAGQRVLLLGDALSPNSDYPELPKASLEMTRIESHFPAHNETIFSGPEANPDAYLSSDPGQFAYIHFVAHGVASLTDPLDSAIILSRSTASEDSFKLYARSIIQHPIHARLVTISSCYGGGTRSFVGEGLVGLSWAFLRAGAHNVIGALWEVSDNSTPALMDSLYRGLERGLPPSAALRQAKLELLHGQGGYSNPFFWAPFQIYTGL
jgi:CHAT domain-containing protein/Tfp pilus assembly protein PilF